jgi:hypothetical protein
MNQGLWLPRLAGVSGKFEVGDDADPESIYVMPGANGSFHSK